MDKILSLSTEREEGGGGGGSDAGGGHDGRESSSFSGSVEFRVAPPTRGVDVCIIIIIIIIILSCLCPEEKEEEEKLLLGRAREMDYNRCIYIYGRGACQKITRIGRVV